MSQHQVAGAVAALLKDGRGFDVTYLSKIENARLPPPSAAAIAALADVLDLPSDELSGLARKVPADMGAQLTADTESLAIYRSLFDLNLNATELRNLLEEATRRKREK